MTVRTCICWQCSWNTFFYRQHYLKHYPLQYKFISKKHYRLFDGFWERFKQQHAFKYKTIHETTKLKDYAITSKYDFQLNTIWVTLNTILAHWSFAVPLNGVQCLEAPQTHLSFQLICLLKRTDTFVRKKD